MVNPAEAYKKTQVNTATPIMLILMLYDGALKFLERAKSAVAERNNEQAHKNLMKTQDIIQELMVTLNIDAGEIAHRLLALYQYMSRRLMEANARKDPEIIQEVIDLLAELKTAWVEIRRVQP